MRLVAALALLLSSRSGWSFQVQYGTEYDSFTYFAPTTSTPPQLASAAHVLLCCCVAGNTARCIYVRWLIMHSPLFAYEQCYNSIPVPKVVHFVAKLDV